MEPSIDWFTIGAVGLIVILVAIASRVFASRPSATTDDGPTVSPLLCSFVHHDGKEIGETVAIDGDSVIIKRDGAFFGVPSEQLQGGDAEVTLTGEVDWEAAGAIGSAWHEKVTAGQDSAITSQLTTSADIKAPAREAFLERTSEEE